MILFDPFEMPAHVDEYHPRHNIRIDTTFWQHKSIFAGSQEQLNELRRDADARAAARARAQPSIYDVHRPVFRRIKLIVHVGFIPLLWAITTCRCGDRWPCNGITQYARRRLGWRIDIDEYLKTLTKRLPKPANRFSRLRRFLSRWRSKPSDSSPRGSHGLAADRSVNHSCDRWHRRPRPRTSARPLR